MNSPYRALLACLLIASCAEVNDHPAPERQGLSTQRAALTIGVPADYASIQAAIDGAQPGDTVAVAAGEYTEQLVLAEGVHLLGAGKDETIIRGTIKTTDVKVGSIRHLQLQSTGSLTGIQGWDTGVVVTDCHIEGFSNGVDVTAASESVIPRFERNLFKGNSAGLTVTGGAGVVAYANIFAFNPYAGVHIEGASSDIIANTFVANGTGEESANLMLFDNPGTVADNIITGGNWGIYCGDCLVTLSHNNVWGNSTNYEEIVAGPTDVSLDPEFVNAGEGDFHLKPSSPCIDAGGAADEPALDFDGEKRPQGDGPDIGADEFGVPEPSFRISEVMANPLSEGSGEFIEFVNTSGELQDAAGLVIGDGDRFDVLVGWAGGTTMVPIGGYAIVLDPDYDEVYDIAVEAIRLTVAESKTLGSGLAVNDPVRLYEPGGTTLIDAYNYPFDPGNGISAEKIELGAPDSPSAWRTSLCSASPGSPSCAGAPVQGNEIRITEVMANPVSSSTGEFVELVNTAADPVDLAGTMLTDDDSTDTLADGGQGMVLGPGQVAIILDPDYANDYEIDPAALILGIESTVALGNGLALSDPVTLLRPDGKTVAATYSYPIATPSGVSVERVVLEGPDAPGNWAPSTCLGGASPGTLGCDAPAPATPPTLKLSEVMANPLVEDTGEFVEVYNYGESEVDVAGLILSDGDAFDTLAGWEGGTSLVPAKGIGIILDPEYAGEYDIPAAATLLTVAESTHLGSGLAVNDAIKLLMSDGATTIDSFLAPFNPGNGISATRVEILGPDTPGNWAASTCEEGSSPGSLTCGDEPAPPPPAESLVITEIMANPVIEATEEYVELYNPTDGPLDAGGLHLDDGGELDSITGWNGGPAIVPSLGYAVVFDAGYTPGVATDLALDDFEDDVLDPSWVIYEEPAVTGSVDETGGSLVISPTKAGALGLALDGAENFAARGLSLKATITLPTDTGGDEVSAILQLGSDASGDHAAMETYAYVRFVAIGTNRNVELWTRLKGGDAKRIWSWQPGVFNGPKATQHLRLDLDRTHVRVFHNDDDDLFIAAPHGLDTESFAKAHALLLARIEADPSQAQAVSFEAAHIWRSPYDVPGEAVLLTTDDSTIGNGLAVGDTLTLLGADGAVVLDSYTFPISTADGVSVEKTDVAAGDKADNWVEASCGANPGRVSCSGPKIYTATWIDADYSEGGHEWWRAIGWSPGFDPDSYAASCESTVVCPGHQMEYQDNVAASKAFTFTNPYNDSAVKFWERSSPTDCYECFSAVVTVPAGETMIIPASSLGYYFVETTKALNGMDYDFVFYWNPPAEAMMPPFQVVVK